MNRRNFFRRAFGSVAGIATATAAGPAVAAAVKSVPVKKLPSEMSAAELADYFGKGPDAIAKLDRFLDRRLAEAEGAEKPRPDSPEPA